MKRHRTSEYAGKLAIWVRPTDRQRIIQAAGELECSISELLRETIRLGLTRAIQSIRTRADRNIQA